MLIGGHQLGHHPHRRDLVLTQLTRQPVDRPGQLLGAEPGTPVGKRVEHPLKLDRSVLDTHTRVLTDRR